uniref:Putative secreted protein n=1 Tax=Anopheles darlingi TaxID=43151 RepID=A0A2M4DHR8_ANODA
MHFFYFYFPFLILINMITSDSKATRRGGIFSLERYRDSTVHDTHAKEQGRRRNCESNKTTKMSLSSPRSNQIEIEKNLYSLVWGRMGIIKRH